MDFNWHTIHPQIHIYYNVKVRVILSVKQQVWLVCKKSQRKLRKYWHCIIQWLAQWMKAERLLAERRQRQSNNDIGRRWRCLRNRNNRKICHNDSAIMQKLGRKWLQMDTRWIRLESCTLTESQFNWYYKGKGFTTFKILCFLLFFYKTFTITFKEFKLFTDF